MSLRFTVNRILKERVIWDDLYNVIRKMIIISFGGGLGNQMYEYAFLMKMKTLYPNQKFKIDTKYSFKLAHNGYELDRVFGIKEEQCTCFEYHNLSESSYEAINIKFIRELLYFLRKIKWRVIGKKKSFIQQKDFTAYEESFFNLEQDKSYFLYGVFANYKYFDDMKDAVIRAFHFPKIEDAQNCYYRELIQKSNSVSIHIRRGDYIQERVPLPSEKFYDDAMSILQNQVEDICYFVFTDDVEYAKEKFLHMKNVYLIEGNGGPNSYRDMQLMSLCKHNIVANSTFSFWGAYLNNNSGKIVIAPNLPFRKCHFPFVCDDWILI